VLNLVKNMDSTVKITVDANSVLEIKVTLYLQNNPNSFNAIRNNLKPDIFPLMNNSYYHLF